jgi:hypothetical protein
MAGVKISELPAATSPVAPTDVLAVVQGGATRKAAIDQLGFLQSGTGAVTRTAQAKMRETVSVADFGAVGDGVVDDAAAIQAALNAATGKTLEFAAGTTYRVNSTLTIKGDGTKIKGNGATINSYATVSGITYELIGGTRYPYNINVEDLSLNSYGVGAYAWRILTSYSTYRRCSIGIPAVNVSGRGFALVGDEANGTGPYYNTFVNCDAQSGSAGLDHIGFSFISVAPSFNRAPNANTFVGCRSASCFQNWNIKGNGNTLINPISESPIGTGTGFLFEATTATNCVQNFIFGAYLEAPATGFYFSADAQNNMVTGAFGTGVTTWKNDLGTGNQVHTAIGPWSMPTGINFPSTSADPNVLDYYGEGTWTPVPTNITVNSGTPVWSGKYTRIGNQVTVSVVMTGGNVTINAGTSYVTLPFTASNVTWGVFGQNATTARLGAVATYGNLLYFADAATQSSIGASITFQI